MQSRPASTLLELRKCLEYGALHQDKQHKDVVPKALMHINILNILYFLSRHEVITVLSNTKLHIHARYITAQDMQAYNEQFRGKDAVTDILTFVSHVPSPEKGVPHTHMIDMLFCPSYISAQAQEKTQSLYAHYMHLHIHGILHGFDYTHEEDKEAKEMERAEIATLEHMGFLNPYS